MPLENISLVDSFGKFFKICYDNYFFFNSQVFFFIPQTASLKNCQAILLRISMHIYEMVPSENNLRVFVASEIPLKIPQAI